MAQLCAPGTLAAQLCAPGTLAAQLCASGTLAAQLCAPGTLAAQLCALWYPRRPSYAPLVPSRPSYAPSYPRGPAMRPWYPRGPAMRPWYPRGPAMRPWYPRGPTMRLWHPACVSCSPGHAPPQACRPNATQAMRPRMPVFVMLPSHAPSLPVINRSAKGCYTPFANWSTGSSIGVGELLWWLEMRVLISPVCESASRGFCGVLETQRSAEATGGPVGVGVRNRMSSLERTLSGSYGTRPAPAKPPCMFFSVMEAKKASRNPQRNSSLLTWLICARIKSSIWRPYACFNGPKQPTSSGWRRWEECGGIQSVIMLWFWQ